MDEMGDMKIEKEGDLRNVMQSARTKSNQLLPYPKLNDGFKTLNLNVI